MPTPLLLVTGFLSLIVPLDVVQGVVLSSRHSDQAGQFWIALAVFVPLYLAGVVGLWRRQRWAWVLAVVVSALATVGGISSLATGRVSGLFNALFGPALLAMLFQRSSRGWAGT